MSYLGERLCAIMHLVDMRRKRTNEMEKNSMTKKILSFVLAMTLIVSLFAGLTVTASAEDDGKVWTLLGGSDAIASAAGAGTVAITMTTSDGATFALYNGNGTSSAPTAVAATVEGNTLTIAGDNSTIGWTIEAVDGGYTITSAADSNTWLYSTNSNNGVRVGSDDDKVWTIDTASGYLKHVSTGRYMGVYNKADWRTYTTLHNNIAGETLQFWLLTDAGSAHEHNWGAWTSNDDGTHSRSCAGENCPVGTQTENCSFDEGTVTTQPTCVAEGVKHFTCTVCGYEKDEAVPATGEHMDANNDGACDVCGEEMPTATIFTLGTEIHEGDQVVIYSVNGKLALSVNASGSRLTGTAVSIEGVDLTVMSNDLNTAVMTVEFVDAQNFLLKTADGKYLTTGATGNSLSFADAATDYSQWYLSAMDSSTVFIKNTNAKYNNRVQALEFYNNLFTAYSEGTGAEYQFQLYIHANQSAHVHDWTGAVTTEPSCTAKGVKTFTCSGCDESYTEDIPMIPHVDANDDGLCDTCQGVIYTASTTLNDGDRVIVVFDAESKAMTSTTADTKLAPAEVNAQSGITVPVAENNIWTVKTADEGFYLLSRDSKYLTTAETGGSLTLEEAATDYSLWSLEVVDADAKIVYVRSVNAAYNGNKNQAVEFYNNLFTTYGLKDNNSIDAFKLVLYTLPAEAEPIADGFYLLVAHSDADWTVDSINEEQKFEENPNAQGEYLLSTSLAVDDQIKVVRVENGEITGWWPNGEGTQYHVDEAHSGNVTIFFKTDYVNDWAEFGGYFYIGSLLKPSISADVYGCSISLKGNIALNFYVIPSEELHADPDAYVMLGETKLLFSEATTRTVGEDTLYQFTLSLHAKQMNDVVTLRVYDGEDNLVALYRHSNDEDVTETGYSYSVQTYIQTVRDTSSDTKLIALVNAMSDYGSLAQAQFGYNADSRVAVQADLSGVTAADVESFQAVKTDGTATGVSYYGTSLLLQSETVMRIYFTLDEGEISDYTFKLGSKKVTPVQSDGKWYVEIANISAKDLDKTYTLTVSSAEGKIVTIKASALSYVYAVLNGGSNEATLIDLVKGLYLYNQAANEYFGK